MKTNQTLFIDCEFNGFGGALISMALAASDGHNWYGILPLPAVLDPWVAQHVIPVLDTRSADIIASTPAQFRSSLYAYLGRYDNPTIIADWPSDLVHFHLQLLGESHALTFPYPCATVLDLSLDARGKIPHNALSDSIALRVAHGQSKTQRDQRHPTP